MRKNSLGPNKSRGPNSLEKIANPDKLMNKTNYH